VLAVGDIAARRPRYIDPGSTAYDRNRTWLDTVAEPANEFGRQALVAGPYFVATAFQLLGRVITPLLGRYQR